MDPNELAYHGGGFLANVGVLIGYLRWASRRGNKSDAPSLTKLGHIESGVDELKGTMSELRADLKAAVHQWATVDKELAIVKARLETVEGEVSRLREWKHEIGNWLTINFGLTPPRGTKIPPGGG